MKDIKYGRKASGIKAEIRINIEKWLKTIDDKDLVKQIRENVIVTGGCIASMLLGEEVNDYDVYFKNIETAANVAKYYTKSFGKDVSIYCEEKENIKGEIENRVLIDIGTRGIIKVTPKKGSKYGLVNISSNALTLQNKIQLITRFYGSPSEIHNNYDFAHAKCYFDYSDDYLHLDSKAMECLLSRVLIYQGSLYPIASMFRMKKFLLRGWRVSAGQQFKMMYQASMIDLTNIETLKEQLIGVDFWYMKDFISELEKVKKVNDDDHIDETEVMKLIDKIFSEE